MLTCRHCRETAAADPANAMVCGGCNAAPGQPCGWHGTPCDTHDGREQTALFYRFSRPCPARKGREPHQFRFACAAAPAAEGLPLFSSR